MKKNEAWLLPQGIEEALPAEAAQLESLRRQILDMYASWGYQLVIPPTVDYLDSLLTGTGYDLDIQTFKLIDQLTGKSLGVRADMTPQVARIDAHHLKAEISRLCYIGTVLHTRPDGFAGSRSPIQVGAELYGHAGIESDAEVIELMLKTLSMAGLEQVYLDLGHVGIYRSLAKQANLSKSLEAELFDMMQRKALAEIKEFVAVQNLDDEIAQMLLKLPELNGDEKVIDQAITVLKAAADDVLQALDYLKQVSRVLKARIGDINLNFDLAELRGYHFHTGIVFTAFVPGQGQEVARGGRYDEIGEVFGRARPATGFSTDLKTLIDLGSPAVVNSGNGILAAADIDSELQQLIETLRAAGECVIQLLPGQQSDASAMNCNRIIQKTNNKWHVVEAK
ncbi:MAG: ATP phosphoribosyltransferase regulatory subunit [Gammaproteobacteria bacterium]|nr:ATP phosphoribosyltransferase regulatory subunit [Gammaproteobacteria bacterium]